MVIYSFYGVPVYSETMKTEIIRGKTFINNKKVIGKNAAMIKLRGTRIFFINNRIYNRGQIIGKNSSSMVRYLPNNKKRIIKSQNNTFNNSGSIICNYDLKGGILK